MASRSFFPNDKKNVKGAPGLLIIASALLSIIAAGGIALWPLLVVVPISLVCVALFLAFPTFRLVTVLFGALVVFQSSDSVSASKILYLFAVASMIVVSLVTMHQLQDRAAYRLLLPLVLASLVSYAGIAATLVVSSVNGIPISSWVRDAATYALLASIPIVAMDAQRIRFVILERILVVLGLVSAVSVGVGWAAKRGYLELPLDRLLLASASPAYALLFYSFIRLIADEHPGLKWLAYIGFVSGMLVMSGSRSAFFAFLALIPLFLLIKGGLERKLNRIVASAAVSTVVLTCTVVMVAQTELIDFSGVVERFQKIPSFLSQPSGDPSFNERTIQTRLAWSTFENHPIVGTGPGHIFEVFRPTSNRFTESMVMDTSLVYLVKFGLIGLAWLLIVCVLYGLLCINASRRENGADLVLLVIAWSSYTLVYLPFVSVFDDKGYPLAFSILLAIGLRQIGPDVSKKVVGRRRQKSRRRSTNASVSADAILQPR